MPIIFKDERIGKEGKIFILFKFRTMKEDTNNFFNKYLLENNEAKIEWESTHKLKKDPRITKLGFYLRKFSIDELPQLWNVLIGNMSLVGPRPILSDQTRKPLIPSLFFSSKINEKKYEKYLTKYITVNPGITGLWQVSGRNEISYLHRINLDLFYIENSSLFLDICILMKTIPVVFFGRGAY